MAVKEEAVINLMTNLATRYKRMYPGNVEMITRKMLELLERLQVGDLKESELDFIENESIRIVCYNNKGFMVGPTNHLHCSWTDEYTCKQKYDSAANKEAVETAMKVESDEIDPESAPPFQVNYNFWDGQKCINTPFRAYMKFGPCSQADYHFDEKTGLCNPTRAQCQPSGQFTLTPATKYGSHINSCERTGMGEVLGFLFGDTVTGALSNIYVV